MLDSRYLKFPINKEDTFTVETNYSPDSTPYEKFKFVLDGKEVVIDRSKLFGLLFLFADERQQEDLITFKKMKMRNVTRLLSFRTEKDIKKGDILKAPFTYALPEETVDEMIRLNPDIYREADIKSK